jgi:CTP synthase
MSPYQHGEVFVTDDGAETDLDLGHYERFIDETLNNSNNLLRQGLLERAQPERRGEYLGETVQIIPHITNEIKGRIYSVEPSDRSRRGHHRDRRHRGRHRVPALPRGHPPGGPERGTGKRGLFIHVSLVPIPGSGEHKSKPTQHSVKELQSMGIQPDMLVLPLRRAAHRTTSAARSPCSATCSPTASSRT